MDLNRLEEAESTGFTVLLAQEVSERGREASCLGIYYYDAVIC